MNANRNGSASDIAQRLGCDPDLLAQLMERVQAGEVSPAAATELLLAGERSLTSPSETPAESPAAALEQHSCSQLSSRAARPPAAGETLATLIDRLGTPPEDIVGTWCQQLRILAGKHFSRSGQPLPVIDLNDWRIDPAGRLRCRLLEVSDNSEDVDTGDLDAVSADRIDQFHKSLAAAASKADPASTEAAPVLVADVGEPGQVEAADSTSGVVKRGRNAGPARIAAGLIGLGIVAGILIHAYQNDDQQSQTAVARATTAAKVQSDPAAADSEPAGIDPRSAIVAQQLERFASPPLDEPSGETVSLEAALPNPTDLMAGGTTPSSDLNAADLPPEQPNVATPADAASVVSMDSKPLDILSEQEGPAPAESPQLTRTSQVRSVKLPLPSDVDAAVALSKASAGPFHLQFPFEVALKSRHSDAGAEIFAVGKGLTVGRIRRGGQGATFSWSSQAGKLSTASALVHGRFHVAAGDTVYLRPTVQADPWPIDLEQQDVRPTWDLLAPLPPRVARLSIEFQLPAEVEQGWIEAIDPTSPQRARGLAVLTLRDDESVALGMRFDIRGGRKLSCRVRYAARLGPESPWHAVSRPLLEQFADQLAAQAEINSQQIARMSALYSAADTTARRALRPRRDAIEQQAKAFQQLSPRVSQLQSLIAHVEAAGTLKLRVWVSWPDGEQTLLETM